MNLFRRWWPPAARAVRRRSTRPTLECLEDRTVPAVITVTSNADTIALDGEVTLREALLSINRGLRINADVVRLGRFGAKDTINFNIGGGGAQTISVASALPKIRNPVTIDGTSQPGFVDTPLIELNGAGAGAGVAGLDLAEEKLKDCLITGLLITGFDDAGIDISGNATSDNRVVGNVIRDNGIGVAIRGRQNANNNAVVDNTIENNDTAGVLIVEPNNNLVSENTIRGNGTAGVLIVAGNSNDVIGNTIENNGDAGVSLVDRANANRVVGNTIQANGDDEGDDAGVFVDDSNGNRVAGNQITNNQGDGVRIVNGASGNIVGGDEAGAGNTITANRTGVVVGSSLTDNAIQNFISRNSIFDNDELGIDLGDNGVTPNDPGDVDTGPNRLINFPVLERAVIIGTDLVIEGSAVPGATIEFFIADPDPSGFGEGQTYLVTRTEGRARDADDTGNRFRFVIPLADLAAPVMAGDLLTSTATRATDGTSEFSGNIEIDGDEPQVPVADLAVTKRANVPGVVVGQLVTFTITARNLGPDLALGVVVTDLLPPGMAFVSAKPSQGFYQPGTGEWNVIALAPDGSATLRLTGRVTAAGTIRNTASIAFPGVDPNPSNNVDRLTLPPGADLAVTKMVTPAAPAFGTPATFTLVVRNLGPGLATGVVLHDPLPAGLTFLGATASQGVYNPASGVWTVGNLGAGGMAVLQIVVRMDTVLPVVNTAVVTSASFDPNLSNNLASALVAALISKRPFLSFPGAA